MKTVSTILLLLAIYGCSLNAGATNYNNYGTFATYNLNSGDTLRIHQGTFTGVVANLPSGAVIIVAQDANFAPTVINFWAPVGKIINNGTVQLNGIGLGSGFNMENNHIVTVSGNFEFYSGPAKLLTNNTGARLTVNGALSAGENTTIINKGIITTTAAFNLYNSTSVLNNQGMINVGGSLNSSGQITNEYVIKTAANFNYYAGTVNNTGAIIPDGSFSVSNGMTYVNRCRLITKSGVNNYGVFQNHGLLWAGTSGTASDQLTTSGSFFNASGARIRTRDFTNYGSFTGSGFIYVTGVTTLGSSASIGVNGSTGDTIKLYDLTRSNGATIFDNQWGAVRPNVKYEAFPSPDSIEVASGCSDIFKAAASGSSLPVRWNYFYVRLVERQPMLFWSAEYETGMQFSVERSYNNRDFTVIGSLTSTTSAAYSHKDENLNANEPIAYYRIKGFSAVDGTTKYTSVQAIQTGRKQSIIAQLYPNPSKGEAAISFQSGTAGAVLVRISNVNGQQLTLRNVQVNTGINKITLDETHRLSPGVYIIDLIQGSEVIASEKLILEK